MTKSLPNNYYNKSPYGKIQTGDIFSDLPSMGLLKQDLINGIIITPSCDLANNKTETITYLPIVQIKEWLCTYNFYSHIKNEVIQWGKNLNLVWTNELANEIPELLLLNEIVNECNQSDLKKENQIKSKKRIIAGVNLIKEIINWNCTEFNKENFETFFEDSFEKISSKLITNSYSQDIHFLPSENQDINNCIVIKGHSLVLFRYPITIPFEILDFAKDCSNMNPWEQYLSKQPQKSCLKAFRNIPLRGLKLEISYLSDLLTRYVGLYVRMGSPDFDKPTIEHLKDELKKQIN